jgi:uncharacterized delta-60 repeat protein
MNTVPGTQTAVEDVDLNIAGVSIASAATTLKVALSTQHGQLSLASTAGLGFYQGDGSGDSVMIFRGSQADVNAALAGLVYRGVSDYSGGDTITLASGDDAGAGPEDDTDTISVNVNAVNDAPTFAVGDGTFLTTDFGRDESAAAIAVQRDGKIVLGGSADPTDTMFALARYNAAGTLDTTFDGDGKLTTQIGANGTSDRIEDLALMPDGRIVAAGEINAGIMDTRLALARYNTNGSLDTSFDSDGKVTTAVTGLSAASELLLLPDGRSVVAGIGRSSGRVTDVAIIAVRYNLDGTLDTSFDGDGIVITHNDAAPPSPTGSPAPQSARGLAAALQADGKVLVTGDAPETSGNLALVRYNTDGSIDPEFGLLVIQGGGTGSAIAVQPDGAIVIAGTTGTQVFLARYHSSGSADQGFGDGGRLTTSTGGANNAVKDMVLQPDGRIVMAGSTTVGGETRGFLIRLNSDGTLDSTFDGDGKLIIGTAGFQSNVNSIALQPDGKILVAGDVRAVGARTDFAVARLNADGSADPTFHPVNTLDATPLYFAGSPAIVLDGHARVFDADLSAQGNYGGAAVTLHRSGGGNAQDQFSGTGLLGALTEGQPLVYDGATVGTVTTRSAGTLTLTFDSNATQARVDGVLQAIGYSNASAAPPSTVSIEWFFSDGNSGGAQGTGGVLTTTSTITVTVVNQGWIEDRNGDHKSDLLWHSNAGGVDAWQMNGAQIAASAQLGPVDTHWTIVDARGDYDADGTSDILWRHTDGRVDVWLMNGNLLRASASLGTVSTDWMIVDAHADYGGDGRSDILWRNTADGRVETWQMNGVVRSGTNALGAVPLDWSIVAAHGDYNGDGANDILWRNLDGRLEVWQMNGAQVIPTPLNAVPTDWAIVDARGDYNGDGKSDILWRNADGRIDLWQMNGAQVNSTSLNAVPLQWSIVDAHGDYNADGKSDILWRNADGRIDVWQMNGAQVTDVLIAPQAPASWTLIDGHGDYNADGRSDIMWRDASGALRLWQMNGTTQPATSVVGSLPLDWSVADAAERTGVLTGDAAGTTLTGTVTRDSLFGKGGNDSLTGGPQADRFVMDTAPDGATNNDTITDFAPGSDKLVLSEVIYSSVPSGPLAAGSFVSGSSPAAADADDHILYDTTTGAVSYDADGSGPTDAIVFATLSNHPALTAQDVYIGLI